MANFSISQFKQHVANFITAAKIDNGNGIIESENGELAKVLSNFGKEESQIGDLLEVGKTTPAAKAPSNQPYPDDVHKEFMEANKKYEAMTSDQKEYVRTKTAIEAINNFKKLEEAVAPQIEKLYEGKENFANIDKDALVNKLITKETIEQVITSAITERASLAHEKMSDMITTYDKAYSEYDITYRSPFELKSTQAGGLIIEATIADNCRSQILAKLQEYLAFLDTASLSDENVVTKALDLINDVDSLIKEKTEYIQTVGDGIYNIYSNDLDSSLDALKDGDLYVDIAVLDDKPHEDEGPHIAIKGAPIKKTFTDVVNETVATGVSDVKSNQKTSQVYDLSGRPVSGDLRSGQIYIQNGKKFVAP